jgi:hypothetical protein
MSVSRTIRNIAKRIPGVRALYRWVMKPEPAPLIHPKVHPHDVHAAIATAKSRWPGQKVIVLADQYTPAPSWPEPTVRCDQTQPSQLEDGAVFIFACESDQIGLPFIREIVKRGGRFLPPGTGTVSNYAHINDLARNVIETEYRRQSAEGFAKFDLGPGDFLNIIQALDLTRNVPGAFVEIGCFRGSSSCVAVSYMQRAGIRRPCYFLDVFEGFNYQAAKDSADAFWEGTHGTEGPDVVAARIRAAGPDVQISVQRSNIIENALPAEIERIALVNLDVDLYEAVAAGLEKVAPKMAPGGIIIVEDPGHTPMLIGSRLALEEFLAKQPAGQFLPIYMESGQTFLVKR